MIEFVAGVLVGGIVGGIVINALQQPTYIVVEDRRVLSNHKYNFDFSDVYSYRGKLVSEMTVEERMKMYEEVTAFFL